MKRGTTFEEYEKDARSFEHFIHITLILSIVSILIGIVISLFALIATGLLLLFMAFFFAKEFEEMKNRYRFSAETEYVEVNSFCLEEFAKKGRYGKVFEKNGNEFEFVYIDTCGKINHKKLSSFNASFDIFNCIDGEKIVLKECCYTDDRFTKVFGTAPSRMKYEIYVKIENFIIIG
ncbi:hypothetical protein I6N96_12690 [Enterococcus sp. BWM-S5]|uniref:Uncharacterized protein n=1 Tax=Enterococcus larvae TaxID=2794352 RepID=A0ABS4CKJ4_9ENTE|nr:hypothetical protein [Enterococcus larvae]MBP1047131.1 hypothetical protein [Enterococcus larvae]